MSEQDPQSIALADGIVRNLPLGGFIPSTAYLIFLLLHLLRFDRHLPFFFSIFTPLLLIFDSKCSLPLFTTSRHMPRLLSSSLIPEQLQCRHQKTVFASMESPAIYPDIASTPTSCDVTIYCACVCTWLDVFEFNLLQWHLLDHSKRRTMITTL